MWSAQTNLTKRAVWILHAITASLKITLLKSYFFADTHTTRRQGTYERLAIAAARRKQAKKLNAKTDRARTYPQVYVFVMKMVTGEIGPLTARNERACRRSVPSHVLAVPSFSLVLMHFCSAPKPHT